MRKFFVKSNQIHDKIIDIIGEDVNHIKNVLRLEKNEIIKICDSDNSINYICEINELNKESVKCNIIETAENEAEGKVKLDIYQGLPKADKMELIIQKGTELGVSKFIPTKFDRCIVKLEGKDEIKKIERWQKISEVAAKQSGRDLIPEIGKITTLNQININEYDLVILAYEEEKENTIKNELKRLNLKDNLKIAIIIGPEGGIAPKEVEILKEKGAKIVTLGNRILRTETVALYVASVIMYELEM